MNLELVIDMEWCKYIINTRSNTKLPIKIGSRGGLSVQSRSSKNRRYIKSTCKKTKCDGQFWRTVDSIRKSNRKTRK